MVKGLSWFVQTLRQDGVREEAVVDRTERIELKDSSADALTPGET
jgi:hypothetical protein